MSIIKELSALKGLGVKSSTMLYAIGITSVDQFYSTDPFVIYHSLKQQKEGASLNFLYAIIGAQQNIHWQQVKRQQRSEILIRLDDMGIAPIKKRYKSKNT